MGVMAARTPDAVLDELLALLPPSRWLNRARGGGFAGLLAGPAAAIADAEAQAVGFGEEIDPATASALLPDFQRVLGPDPCGRDLLTLSPGDLRALVFSRWVLRGGQSAAFFIGLAAALGTTITITERRIGECGVSVCGDDLEVQGNQFCWIVNLPYSRAVMSVAGGAECGDALGSFLQNLCECVIRLFAPAHTSVFFNYH